MADEERIERLRGFIADADPGNPATTPTEISDAADPSPDRTVRPTDPTVSTGPEAEVSSDGDDRADRPTPSRIGPFAIERELARGGMGVVYLARHEALDRRVAVKVLLAGDHASRAQLERFAIEARTAARLRHPHIVGIHEVGEDDDGRPFLVMDLIEGRSLRDRIRGDGPLPPRDAAAIAEKLARALSYAHERAVLHRDLKPANVLLDDASGEPLLTDFGLAKEVERSQGITASGQAMGTPAYMPPEQAEGRPDRIDRRADVYSLGATLYEMLTGRPPFVGESVLELIQAVLTRDPPPPSRLRAGLDRDLETICLVCLAKEPEARYGSAEALADDLRRYLRHEPIAARRPGPIERARKWIRRNRTLAGTAAAIVAVASIVLAIGAVESFRRIGAERDQAVAERRTAEDAAAEALSALAILVYGVHDELAKIPGPEARQARLDVLATAAGRLAELQRFEDAGVLEGFAASRAEAFHRIGKLAALDGGLGTARDALERARAIVGADRRRDPDAEGALLEWAAIHGDLGDVHRELGDLDEAAACVAERLAAAERLLARNPADGSALLHLAEALEQRSVIREQLGDPEAARDLQNGAVLIWRRLIAVDGGDGIPHLLASALHRRASLIREAGLMTESVEAFGELIELAREHQLDGDRATYQLLFELANAHLARGEADAAAAAADRALTLARASLEADPTAPSRMTNVAAALEVIAGARTVLGELEAARDAALELAWIGRALVALDPDNAQARRELAVSLRRAGYAELSLETADGLNAATARFAEAVDLQAALVAAAPDNVLDRRALSVAEDDHGSTLLQTGDVTGAIAAYRRAAAHATILIERDPDAVSARMSLATSLSNLAEGLSRAGVPLDEQIAVVDRLAATIGEVIAADPDEPEYRRRLATTHFRLGDLAAARGDREGALAAYRATVEARRRVLAVMPDDPATRVEVAGDLGKVARVLHALGRRAEAIAATKELLGHLEGIEPAQAQARFREWMVQVPRMLPFLEREHAVIEGDVAPSNGHEHHLRAGSLSEAGEWAEALGHYEAALRDPAVRDDRSRYALYNAACTASMASAESDDPDETAGLRANAIAWLAADLRMRRSALAELEALLESGETDPRLPDAIELERARLAKHLLWAHRDDAELAAVRGEPGFEALFAGDDAGD